MTRVEAFTAAAEIITGAYADNGEVLGKYEAVAADIAEVLIGQAEKLKAKSTAPKKPTAQQLENEVYATGIIESLGALDRPVTIAELVENYADLKNISAQRLNAILSQLRKRGDVKRTYEKGKAHFELGFDDVYLTEVASTVEEAEGEDA